MILRGWLDECEAAWWGWRVGGWQGVEYRARGCMRKQTARLSFHASFYANANDMEGGGGARGLSHSSFCFPAFVDCTADASGGWGACVGCIVFRCCRGHTGRPPVSVRSDTHDFGAALPTHTLRS